MTGGVEMRVKTAAASQVQLDRRTMNELRRFLEDKRLVLMASVRSMIWRRAERLGRGLSPLRPSSKPSWFSRGSAAPQVVGRGAAVRPAGGGRYAEALAHMQRGRLARDDGSGRPCWDPDRPGEGCHRPGP